MDAHGRRLRRLRQLSVGLLGWMLLMGGSLVRADWPEGWSPATLPRSLSFELESRHTGQHYRILIGLPHAAPPPGGYPVLWMLDGLATFPLTEVVRPQPVVESLNSQWQQVHGQTPAGLVVAVGYASGKPFDVDARALDYTSEPLADSGDGFSGRHGGADAFLRFLLEELRPLIAARFPVDPQQNTLFGFSYGGLFTVYTLSVAPDSFQRYWAASPSLWFGGAATRDPLLQRLSSLEIQRPTWVTLTVGHDEQDLPAPKDTERQARAASRAMVDNLHRAAAALRASHQAELQVRAQVLADHDHLDMLMQGIRRVIDFAFRPVPGQ